MAKFQIIGHQKFVFTGPNLRAGIVLHLSNKQLIQLPFDDGPDLKYFAIVQLLDSNSECIYDNITKIIESKSGGSLKPFNIDKIIPVV